MTSPDRSGTTIGDYRLDSLLGRGGMGEVYRAFDVRRSRVVALKVLPPEFGHHPELRERFDRESRLAARLEHPHIVPIHDWGQIGDTLFLDMRLIRGRTFGDLLRSERVDIGRSLGILAQIASALDAAHAVGLVHRDVKPDNILIGDGDFAYLLDFGIAQAADNTRLTQTGGVVGSIAYMAPERFEDGPVGPSVDVYALACVLVECLTGRPPFGGSDIPTVMRGHLLESPPRTGTVFDPVIARGLAKAGADRYPSCAELVFAAQAAIARPTPPYAHVSPAPPTVPQFSTTFPRAVPAPPNLLLHDPGLHRTRRRRARVAVATLALVAVLAVGGYLIANRHGEAAQAGTSPSAVTAGSETAGTQTVTCQYPTAAATGIRSVGPPDAAQPRTGSGALHLSMSTGDIDVRLDRALAPCNVAAVETLANAKFLDYQGCSRLSGYILVCSAGGAGPNSPDIQAEFDGPGWTSPNEPPTGLPVAEGKIDSLGRQQVTYPRGAMLITNPGAQEGTDVANGSSSYFFVVKPIITAPLYTMVGEVTSGMTMLDRIVRDGFEPARPGANFGMPNTMPNVVSAVVTS
ncbi:protein kinase domain-containing protein [Gordonia sp. MP11Mi]|uniref:non-specific serine/threonine protein kinase n=1 Tax=Gordonia sp. MP11Mi TaxID=3022769 RepID=A0AA97GVL3_9ACTN